MQDQHQVLRRCVKKEEDCDQSKHKLIGRMRWDHQEAILIIVNAGLREYKMGKLSQCSQVMSRESLSELVLVLKGSSLLVIKPAAKFIPFEEWFLIKKS